MLSSSFLPSEGKTSLGCDAAPQTLQVQPDTTVMSSTHRLGGESSPARTRCHGSPLNASSILFGCMDLGCRHPCNII